MDASDWPTIVLALLVPLGVALGHWITRRGHQDTATWQRREETMRMLRWGGELAAESDARRRDLGVSALIALRGSNLLQSTDEPLVDAILENVVAGSAGVYRATAGGVEFTLPPLPSRSDEVSDGS